MAIWEIIVLAIGLSMDAFAVALCRGVTMKKFHPGQAVVIALFFGVFQAVMPIIGWAVASQFAEYITDYDHWIAFALLVFIGGKMIWDSFKKDEEGEDSEALDKLNIKQLFLMAIATSIDALAVGITFAFLDTNVWIASSTIGCITFGLSFLGVFVGNKIGSRFKNKAELVGGIVLVLLGVKIVIEHMI